jgi:hypothetical protein
MNRRSFLIEAGRLLVALLFLVATAYSETLTPLAVGPIGVTVSDMDRSIQETQCPDLTVRAVR